MPALSSSQIAELNRRLDAAARPHQRDVVPVLGRLAAIDPVGGRADVRSVLLEVIRGDKTVLREAIDVVVHVLIGDTAPHGQVVAVGEAASDPLMELARTVLELHLRGEGQAAWQLLEDVHIARRAAVLSIFTGWLNYEVAGVDLLHASGSG
ncbi:hypothetical protein ACWCQZ_40685 [Streptomyces sp. NPDC002285]